ncbi:MAG: YesL family protein [Treponema sp.]|nr:YesL family protein [Treponema sp.]
MGIFSPDSKFVKFMNWVLDLLLLNVLWFAFSLPVVTIGAATCAAFSVSLKMVDDEEGYIAKMFVKAFKENFKQGTIMWLITAVCIYGLYIEWQLVLKNQDVSVLMIILAIISTAFLLFANIYTYPLIARYENTLPHMIINSFKISVRFFLRTLMIVVVIAIEVLLILWNKWTLFVGIIIGPMFMIYTVSGVSKRIFQKIDAETKNGPDSGTINQ